MINIAAAYLPGLFPELFPFHVQFEPGEFEKGKASLIELDQ